jgi:hypothetical protein
VLFPEPVHARNNGDMSSCCFAIAAKRLDSYLSMAQVEDSVGFLLSTKETIVLVAVAASEGLEKPFPRRVAFLFRGSLFCNAGSSSMHVP